MDPNKSPDYLRRKVQFDLRLYFCSRGMENTKTMKKDHFKLIYHNPSESWAIIKSTDELIKNHHDIDQQVSGLMPETKGDPSCPVQSYCIHTDHLNPDNKFLCPLSLKNVDMINDEVWFGKPKNGKNPLAKFMTEVSKNCELSKIYTNHCIRVTSISMHTRMRFSTSEIMSVSGHKSVQSIAIYQKRDGGCTCPSDDHPWWSNTAQEIQKFTSTTF